MADEYDLNDFDILDGGDERVGTREDTTTFTHSNSKLTSHNVVTAAMKLWMKNKKKDMDSLKFFTDRKTLQHKGKEMFKRLERWYIYHVLNKTFKRSDTARRSHAEQLLLGDPVGIQDPPKSDEFCWTRNVHLTTTAAPARRPTRATAGSSAAGAAAAAATTTAMHEYTQTNFLITSSLQINNKSCLLIKRRNVIPAIQASS